MISKVPNAAFAFKQTVYLCGGFKIRNTCKYSTSKSGISVKLVRIDETNTEEAQNLVKNHYLPNAIFLKKSTFERTKVEELFNHVIARDLKANSSFGYRLNSTGELVACSCSSPINVDKPVDEEAYNVLPAYVRFKSWCLRDLHDQLNTDTYVYVGKTTVHKEFTGLGLASTLVSACETSAKEKGYNHLVTVHSMALGKSMTLGYNTLLKFRFVDYVDPVTGSKPFTMDHPPHNHCTVLHKQL